MREILSDPVYSLNVFYLEGSALNRKDLLRARVDKAIGIFIMCDKNSSNGDIEDSKTLLQHFCIRRFLSSTSSNSFFCIQLIREESRRHLSENEDQTEVIVCLNEIKMGLIAKTSLYPGASTLLLNLVSSFSTYDEKEEEEFTKKGIIVQGGHLIDTLQESHVSSWQQEYTKG
jgi:hypothetical protein